MDKIMKTNLRFLLLFLGISFFSAAYAQDGLTVKWGEGSTYTDISTYTPQNAVEWDISGGTRQLQITADFANLGVTGARTVTVQIPRGFKIQTYTAKSGTAVISGVTQIGLSDTEDSRLISSTLTALSGSAFSSQTITGYTGSFTSANTNYRPYDGKVVYSFTSQCENITLNLGIAIDQMLLPYNATSTVMPTDISVVMLNGANSNNTIESHLTVTVTNMVTPLTVTPTAGVAENAYTRNVEGVVSSSDPNLGTVPAFTTGFAYRLTNNNYYVTSLLRHLSDTMTFVTSYPAGVQYQGFDLGAITPTSTYNTGWWAESHTSENSGGTYGNGHLIVTVDAVNRKVTYKFINIRAGDTNSRTLVRSYWTADVDNSTIKWGARLGFATTMVEVSGSQIGNRQSTATTSGTVTITVLKPAISITLTPQNLMLRDLNAYKPINFDQALGCFMVNNIGPSIPKNINYNFTFPDSPQVRGVSLVAGVAGDGIVSATGYTNTGAMVNYSGTLTVNNSTYFVQLTPELLNLPADQYLKSLTVTQSSLSIMNYNRVYTNTGVDYYGKWINGQTGAVQLTITDENGVQVAPLAPAPPASDNTQIGWTISGAGTMTTVVATPTGNPTNTFYPGQSINFTSTYTANVRMNNNSNPDAIDPDVYICLPKGISLDLSTVFAQSPIGNYGDTRFSLLFTGSSVVLIDGVEWTTYHFKTANRFDLVALSNNQETLPAASRSFNLQYTAILASSCSAYPALTAGQICLLDLGMTAVNATTNTDYTTADVYNLAGKGISYRLVGGVYTANSPNISVVQKPGLQVYLGIKTYNTPGNYYTYNGSPTSIAAVSRNVPAEVSLKYENTSTDNYFTGTEIYLPIPKKNIGYTHFFNNTNTNGPVNVEASQSANKTPEWTSELISEVNLPGFDTYYGIDTSPATNYTSSAIAVNWTPVTMAWYPSAADLPIGKSLADVTMLKFVANDNIGSAGQANSTGQTTFQLSVAPDAQLGQFDYWRSYQKGWRMADGTGSWDYGSVLAATPGMSGVEGLFFYDKNVNGTLDAGEDYTDNMPVTAFTATLMGPGIATSLPMNINPDGSFKSLNADNSTFYLSVGAYTITINNARPDLYHFTTFYPDTRSSFDASNNPVWMNDIPLSLIPTDNASITFTFTVTAQSTITQLVGIGLKGVPTYILVNPHVGGRVASEP